MVRDPDRPCDQLGVRGDAARTSQTHSDARLPHRRVDRRLHAHDRGDFGRRVVVRLTSQDPRFAHARRRFGHRLVACSWAARRAAGCGSRPRPRRGTSLPDAHLPGAAFPSTFGTSDVRGRGRRTLGRRAGVCPPIRRRKSWLPSGDCWTPKQEVGRSLEQMFALRVEFAKLPAGDPRNEQVRLYLRSASQLIDLTGRLHTAAREAIEVAAYHLDAQPQQFRRLLDLLSEKRATVGAEVMSYMLFDPPAGSGAQPYTTQEKYQLLNLILATRHHDLLPYVAAFIRAEKNPSLVVIAAELIHRLGLPQKPRPGGDADQPKPPILAEELHEILTRVREADLPGHLVTYRRDLLAWLQRRMERGIEEDRLRLGPMELRPGDWLLMRNPSPYNLFTDLSPGLFTHVGVVAVEQGEDGIRRFVIVDLPERGADPGHARRDLSLADAALRLPAARGRRSRPHPGTGRRRHDRERIAVRSAVRDQPRDGTERQTAARPVDPHLLRRFLAGLHPAGLAAARRVLSDHRVGGRGQHGEQSASSWGCPSAGTSSRRPEPCSRRTCRSWDAASRCTIRGGRCKRRSLTISPTA